MNDRSAAFFEQNGNLEAAIRERGRAQNDRQGATEDRERARLRRQLLRQPPAIR
jgi:hypothetical protein